MLSRNPFKEIYGERERNWERKEQWIACREGTGWPNASTNLICRMYSPQPMKVIKQNPILTFNRTYPNLIGGQTPCEHVFMQFVVYTISWINWKPLAHVHRDGRTDGFFPDRLRRQSIPCWVPFNEDVQLLSAWRIWLTDWLTWRKRLEPPLRRKEAGIAAACSSTTMHVHTIPWQNTRRYSRLKIA